MVDTILAGVSIVIGVLAMLFQLLYRETITELKRRVGQLESKDDARIIELATIGERSKASAQMLERIAQTMVTRAEWEVRHRASEEMLNRIFETLSQRGQHT